jgi:hypothetical protein
MVSFPIVLHEWSAKTGENTMTAQQPLKSHGRNSKPWRPDPASTREKIWFDDFDRVLYVDFRKTCATYLRIGTWQRGLSIERWDEVLQSWEPEDIDPGISLPFPPHKSNFSVQGFFNDIPQEVISAVRPFQWRQFVLLKMVRHRPAMLELLQSNPVLAWLLADAIASKEIPISVGSKWVLRKRKDILEFAGMPSSNSLVKTLSRIKSAKYTQILFENLKKLICHNDKMSMLRFVQYIPGGEILNLLKHFDYSYWLLSTRDSIGMTIWENLTVDNETDVFHLWTNSKNCAKSLRIACPENQLRKCKSIKDLCDIHDLWLNMYNTSNTDQRNERFLLEYGTYSFPAPPLPGDADIIPITTINELQEEGKEMHNCVGSYVEMIMRRECYIYRVLRPERATLEISDTTDMHHIRQLKLAHNRVPGAETWAKVRYWFASAIQVSYPAESHPISHTFLSMRLPRPSFP